MDTSSTSDSGMDDASMEDSQEHEYEYGSEEHDPHDDYEDIPDDFDGVPEDDDEEEDMDVEDDQPVEIANTLTGVVGDLRMISPIGYRINSFRSDHNSAHMQFDMFRDMLRETMESWHRADRRMQDHVRTMCGVELRGIEPLLFPNRARLASRDPLSLHPALQRPILPTLEPDRLTTTTRDPLRVSVPRAYDRPQTDLVSAINFMMRVSNEVHGESQEPETSMFNELLPRPLSSLEEVDLLRSVTTNSHFNNRGTNSSRSRQFDRLPHRERDREKVSSLLSRRWCYEPQATGGDSLPVMFDGDSAPKRPPRATSRQPMVASETHESLVELASKVTDRIDQLMTELYKIDDYVEKVERNVERRKKEAEIKEAERLKMVSAEAKAKRTPKGDGGTSGAIVRPQGEENAKENMEVTTSREDADQPLESRTASARPTTESGTQAGGLPAATAVASSAEHLSQQNARIARRRSAPGLVNAQEDTQRPDLVMDSVEVAQQRSGDQPDLPDNPPTSTAPETGSIEIEGIEASPEERDASQDADQGQSGEMEVAETDRADNEEGNGTANGTGNEETSEPSGTDFAAVAARRAAAAGISLDAPANTNQDVVAAATESTGIDPVFLAALPQDMRTEILTEYYERIRTNPEADASQSTSQRMTTVNQDFLIALPPELRAEVLQLEAEFQSRQEVANGTGSRETGTGDQAGNGAMAGADMDNATFLATLAPELREEILLESNEAFIRSLPPNMAAEARVLRERYMSSRLPWRVNRQELAMGFQRRALPGGLRGGVLHGRHGQHQAPREPPVFRWKKVDDGFIRECPKEDLEQRATLQKDGLSSLTQLLWLRHGLYGKTLVNQVLSQACKTTSTRHLVLAQLIELITSSPSDTVGHPIWSSEVADTDHARNHSAAVRRALELLVLLCKNDSVVAETLLGLPRTMEDFNKVDSITLTETGEREDQEIPSTSLSTLISLLKKPLFVRSTSRLEQLIGVISTVCHSIPPSKFDSTEKPSERRSRRNGRGRPSMSNHVNEDPLFFAMDNEDDAQSMYDVPDDDGEEEDDSEEDILDVLQRTRAAEDVSVRPENTEKANEGEKDTLIPNRFRIPKLRDTELIALSKVLLRSGCSERIYEKTGKTIGMLGELQGNRHVILLSLANIATDTGHKIQEEYEKCVRSLVESTNGARKGDLVSAFSAASASNELTMLRVVKCVATLLTHEGKQVNECRARSVKGPVTDERKSIAGTENEFQMEMIHGLRGLWEALDKLLHMVPDKGQQKGRKGNERGAGAISAAEVLKADRKRGGIGKGLSALLARLSPMIETFLVIHSIPETVKTGPESASNSSEAQAEPSVPLSPKSPRSQEPYADSPQSSMDAALATFVERHRGPINTLLRANTGLLETSFKGALRHPHAIDFDNKKAYFRNVVRKRSSETHAGTIRIKVRRDRVFDDSYQQLRLRTPEEMKGRLHVQFTGEEGVDAGGVAREWYIILARQIFDANYALFTKSAAKAVTYQPDKRSYINREHLENFHFVGRIIGKAIYDGQLLDAYFTRSFYKHILGMKLTYHDIEAQDPEYYKSLKWMLENDCTGILDYTMSADYEEFGKETVIDLVPNGRNIPVTEENKADYVRLVTDVRMTKTIEKQIEAFKEGFYEIIPHEDCKIFNELELELLMSGLPDIDMRDLKANVEYTGYTASSPQVDWFWRCVGNMDQEDLARLVMFVTGSSKVPLEGFGYLQGMNGAQKFQIHRVAGNTMRLPSAHTCFNQLDLPEYNTPQLLSERLLRAVRECSVGFGFA